MRAQEQPLLVCSDLSWLGTGVIGHLVGHAALISYYNLLLMMVIIAANRYAAVAHAVKVLIRGMRRAA